MIFFRFLFFLERTIFCSRKNDAIDDNDAQHCVRMCVLQYISFYVKTIFFFVD